MASKRILVIDDEELLTKTFSLLLEKNGYEVYTAKNGLDAQVMAEDESFDLIISDVRMPGINGVETVREIQETLKVKSRAPIPIIFITGYADSKMEAEAKSLNPLAYLHKPFNNEELLQTVRKALGK